MVRKSAIVVKRLSTDEYARFPKPLQSFPFWLQTTPSHARPMTLPWMVLPVKSCATSREISFSGVVFHLVRNSQSRFVITLVVYGSAEVARTTIVVYS